MTNAMNRGETQTAGPTAFAVRWTMLFLLACILLVEVIVGRTEFAWRLVPGSDLGTLYQIEESVIHANPKPKVLVLGTSRARGAFLPTVMEEGLGLRRGEVLNLSMGGVSVFDMFVTYQRNRARLAGASLVILQVDPFQFSVGRIPDSRFRKLASWSDRMSYSGRKQADLIADYFFQTTNTLPAFWYYLDAWLENGTAPKLAGIDQYGRLAVVKIAHDHEPQEFTQQRFGYWIDWFYREYEYSPVLEQRFLQMMRMVQEDGAAVVIVMMPMAGNFRELTRGALGEGYDRFRARMFELASEFGAHCVFWEEPANAGLTDRHFRDWGHLNTPGAEKWSEFLGRWIVAERQKNGLTWRASDSLSIKSAAWRDIL